MAYLASPPGNTVVARGYPQDEPTREQDKGQSKRCDKQRENRQRNREIRRLQKYPFEDNQQAKSHMVTVRPSNIVSNLADKEACDSIIAEGYHLTSGSKTPLTSLVLEALNAKVSLRQMKPERTEFISLQDFIERLFEMDSRKADWEVHGKEITDDDFDATLVSAMAWDAGFATAEVNDMEFANEDQLKHLIRVRAVEMIFYTKYLINAKHVREASNTQYTAGDYRSTTVRQLRLFSGLVFSTNDLRYGEIVLSLVTPELQIQMHALLSHWWSLTKSSRSAD